MGRVVDGLFTHVKWTGSLPGIVKQDPVLPDDNPLPPPPARPKNAIFEDEEKSKVKMQKK